MVSKVWISCIATSGLLDMYKIGIVCKITTLHSCLTGSRSIGALNTSTLLNVCFLQCSNSVSKIPTHVFHMRIEIGASKLVLPTARILCWRSTTISLTCLGGLTCSRGPFVLTIVCLSFFSLQELRLFVKSSSADISIDHLEFC